MADGNGKTQPTDKDKQNPGQGDNGQKRPGTGGE